MVSAKQPNARAPPREVLVVSTRPGPLEVLLIATALIISVIIQGWLTFALYFSYIFVEAILFAGIGAALIMAAVGVASFESWGSRGWRLGLVALAGSLGLSLWTFLTAPPIEWTMTYPGGASLSLRLPSDLILPAIWDGIVLTGLLSTYPRSRGAGSGRPRPLQS